MTERRHSRRRWLTGCAGATAALVGLAGCTGDSEDDDDPAADGNGGADEPTDDDTGSGSEGGDGADDEQTETDAWWPMEHYDAANSRVIDEDGPTGELSERWAIQLDVFPSNPAIGYGMVYFQDRDLTQYAVDLETGDIRWEREHDRSGAINTFLPSPVLTDDVVYFLTNEFEAIDPNNGEVRWSIELDARNPESGLVRLTDDGVFVAVGDTLYAIDPETQEVVWEKEMPKHRDMVVSDDGMVVVTRVGGPIERRFEIHGIEAETGDERWAYEPDERTDDGRELTLYDGTVYTTDGDELLGFDVSTGDLETVFEHSGGPSTDAPVIDDGAVFSTYEHIIHPLRKYALESGEVQDNWETAEELRGSTPVRPVVRNDTIFAGSSTQGDKWHSIDIETGKILETYDRRDDTGNNRYIRGFAVTNDVIVLANRSGDESEVVAVEGIE